MQGVNILVRIVRNVCSYIICGKCSHKPWYTIAMYFCNENYEENEMNFASTSLIDGLVDLTQIWNGRYPTPRGCMYTAKLVHFYVSICEL